MNEHDPLTVAIEAALEFAAQAVELFDDKTMENDYMLDAGECAGIIRALKNFPFAPRAAADTERDELVAQLEEDNAALRAQNERFAETLETLINERAALSQQQAKQGPDMVLMPRRLTAENGAKAALSGEFAESITVKCPECGDDEDHSCCDVCDADGEVIQHVPVSWTTIKAIYAKAVELFAAPPQAEAQSKEKTMDEAYGDGSDHAFCESCHLCKTCGDCDKYGCGKRAEAQSKSDKQDGK